MTQSAWGLRPTIERTVETGLEEILKPPAAHPAVGLEEFHWPGKGKPATDNSEAVEVVVAALAGPHVGLKGPLKGFLTSGSASASAAVQQLIASSNLDWTFEDPLRRTFIAAWTAALYGFSGEAATALNRYLLLVEPYEAVVEMLSDEPRMNTESAVDVIHEMLALFGQPPLTSPEHRMDAYLNVVMAWANVLAVLETGEVGEFRVVTQQGDSYAYALSKEDMTSTLGEIQRDMWHTMSRDWTSFVLPMELAINHVVRVSADIQDGKRQITVEMETALLPPPEISLRNVSSYLGRVFRVYRDRAAREGHSSVTIRLAHNPIKRMWPEVVSAPANMTEEAIRGWRVRFLESLEKFRHAGISRSLAREWVDRLEEEKGSPQATVVNIRILDTPRDAAGQEEAAVEQLSAADFTRRTGQATLPGTSSVYIIAGLEERTRIHLFAQATLFAQFERWVSQRVETLPPGLVIATAELPSDPGNLKAPGLVLKDIYLGLPFEAPSSILPILEMSLAAPLPSLATLIFHALKGKAGEVKAVIGMTSWVDANNRRIFAFFA